MVGPIVWAYQKNANEPEDAWLLARNAFASMHHQRIVDRLGFVIG
jgi:hypothetical protein